MALPRSNVAPPLPVIDLEGEVSFDRAHLIKQIIQASQEFGFFQV